MEEKTMRTMMMAMLFTAACSSTMTPPNGHNNGSGSDTGSDTGSGTGSDTGSDMGSGSGGPVGTACTSASDCASGACDLTDQLCVAPAFAFDHTGFIDDGTRWWTNKSNPTLHGTITNPTGQTLTAFVNNTAIGVATITGTTWSLALPANTIAETGTDVVVRMSSTSGDTIEQAQRFALDDKAPTATLTGSVKDERGDTLDFSTGEAVHTHAGAAIALGTAGCPTIYKYAYLEDPARAFGRETSPNPLAWQIEVADSTGIDSMDSAYRVRDAAGHVLYDWTSIQPDASGAYAVALDRSKIAALGTQFGHMFVDVRFRDPFGNESTTSSCWDNHPMAAPLQIGGFSRGALFGWSLPADSPVSHLIDGSGVWSAQVFSQTITQYAGEAITVNLTVPPFSMPYTLATVDDIVAQTPVAANFFCNGNFSNCRTAIPADPADRNTSGTISSYEFEIGVYDIDTLANACQGTGSIITCTLPARPNGSAPVHYQLVVNLRNVDALKPFSEVANAVYGEYTLLGLTYTGQQPVDVVTNCSSLTGTHCLQTTTYTEIRAIDHLTMAFPALTQSITASLDQNAHADAVPYATGALSLPATTWDSGNDDLPGPQ